MGLGPGKESPHVQHLTYSPPALFYIPHLSPQRSPRPNAYIAHRHLAYFPVGVTLSLVSGRRSVELQLRAYYDTTQWRFIMFAATWSSGAAVASSVIPASFVVVLCRVLSSHCKSPRSGQNKLARPPSRLRHIPHGNDNAIYRIHSGLVKHYKVKARVVALWSLVHWCRDVFGTCTLVL
jgi:hypothetical protein